MSAYSSPISCLCRGQLLRTCCAVLNAMVTVLVTIMMISTAAQAADRDMGTSGATFVMPVQTGTAMPVNTRISGSGWVCFAGYALALPSATSQQTTTQQDTGTSVGDQPACVAITPPRNAIIVANSWRCISGFVRDGDRCKIIEVPAYGYIHNSTVTCHAGFALDDLGRCRRITAPANAVIAGNDWRCRPGFRKDAGACIAVTASASGIIRGDDWNCHAGYQRIEDRCEAIIAPPHAYITGNGWSCYQGYRRDRDVCAKVVVPKNATLRGDRWTCNIGYRRSEEACIPLVAPANGYVHGHVTKCFAGFAFDKTGACRRIVVPANATVRNNRWTCNPGFVRSADDQCRKS